MKNEHVIGHLNSLIELGTKGFFPLFSHSWIVDVTKSIDLLPSITTEEKVLVDEIILKLSKHNKLSRKKTVLLSMEINDQKLFLKYFLKKVEDVALFKRNIH